MAENFCETESLPARVFALLGDTPGKEWARADIAAALNAGIEETSRALWQLCEATRRPGGLRRGVVRAGRNRYAYRPASAVPARSFAEVGGDADAVVLRDEAGNLWLARPLEGPR